jgi:hypothetical protein
MSTTGAERDRLQEQVERLLDALEAEQSMHASCKRARDEASAAVLVASRLMDGLGDALADREPGDRRTT